MWTFSFNDCLNGIASIYNSMDVRICSWEEQKEVSLYVWKVMYSTRNAYIHVCIMQTRPKMKVVVFFFLFLLFMFFISSHMLASLPLSCSLTHRLNVCRMVFLLSVVATLELLSSAVYTSIHCLCIQTCTYTTHRVHWDRAYVWSFSNAGISFVHWMKRVKSTHMCNIYK